MATAAAEVDHADSKEVHAMRFSIDASPATYESETVVHTVRHAGQVTVIDHVPAEVCSTCGDVLLAAETVRRIEVLLEQRKQPTTTVPLYVYT